MDVPSVEVQVVVVATRRAAGEATHLHRPHREIFEEEKQPLLGCYIFRCIIVLRPSALFYASGI